MDAFCQHRTWKRARRLGLSQLACLGRHTVAGLICAGGRQADDWPADCRLFARDKWEADDLFVPVVRGVPHMLPDNAPLVTALDDTGLRKTGRKIPGVGYRRDPMSPPFHVNLVPAQRFVQLSAMVPAGQAPSPARGVPVRFHHQPPIRKPKASADEEVKKACREKCRKNNLSTGGRDLIAQLRDEMDHRHHARSRKLLVAGDGGVPWRSVEAYACGKIHAFRIKEMKPILWRKAGVDLPLRIVVIAPLGYRLRKGGKLLYRQAAFLLSTDLDMPIGELLQYYTLALGHRGQSSGRKATHRRGAGTGKVAAVGGPSADLSRGELRLPSVGGVAGLRNQ